MRCGTFARLLCIATITLGVLSPRRANAEPVREFAMSATYGVLAGTLVGAASLAFTDRPGDNLNRVARGASFGLYAGILLGVYIVYVVPSAEEQALESQTGDDSAKTIPQKDSVWSRISFVPSLDLQTYRLNGMMVRGEILRF
jgi:hypothetical protein